MTVTTLRQRPTSVALPDADDPEAALLLVAARRVLTRSGWWGFKVESILREAGLSTRSFYRHYECKNELLMDLLDAEMDRVAVRLSRLTDSSRLPQEQLTDWVEGMTAMAYEEAHTGPASMFAQHWRELLEMYPERMGRVVERLVSTLVPVLERGVETGIWPHVRPEEDAFCVFYSVAPLTADLAAARAGSSGAEISARVLPFIRRALAG